MEVVDVQCSLVLAVVHLVTRAEHFACVHTPLLFFAWCLILIREHRDAFLFVLASLFLVFNIDSSYALARIPSLHVIVLLICICISSLYLIHDSLRRTLS